jgi:hypothetical protein
VENKINDNTILFNFENVIAPDDINAKYIYSKFSQKDIIESFIGTTIDFKKPILSPLRYERNPSFTFKLTNNNDIIWTDWGTGETGDVIKLIQKLYNCSYAKAIEIIYDRLKNNKKILLVNNQENLKIKENDEYKKQNVNSSIIIKDQFFTETDKKYWNSYCINLSTLCKYNVYSVKYLWYNGRLIKTYSNKNPIYAYRFTYDDKTTYKIYFPFEQKGRKWITNTTKRDIQGYAQLPEKGNLLIITKSLKDVMVFYELGYFAIAPQAESINIEDKFIDKLYNRFDNIVVFYDNDLQGINQSKKLKEKFGLEYVNIPKNEYFVKDISDFAKKYGKDETKKFLKKLLTI